MNECQIHCFPRMAEPMSVAEVTWQRRNRVIRILKRRWRYMMNLFSELATTTKSAPMETVQTRKATVPLQPGDTVRVRSKEEIQATLDRWNMLKRCAFMEEMQPYCGTAQRVLRRVEKFLDERDYLLKKCKGIIILDGVLCRGTKDFGACDRSCFFFWREEWLEKVD